MKSISLAFLISISLIINCIGQNGDSNLEVDFVYKAVDKPASFPGGNIEMYNFIVVNLKYPSEVKNRNIAGRIFLKFVVEKDGTINNIEVLKGPGFGLNEEAVRVIELMPKWEPAIHNGKKVRYEFTLPISCLKWE